MANGFGAPPSPYPDTGGQIDPDILQQLQQYALMLQQTGRAPPINPLVGNAAALPIRPGEVPNISQGAPVSGGKRPDSSRGLYSKQPAKRAPPGPLAAPAAGDDSTPTPTAYARPGGEYQVGDPRNPNPPPAGPLAAPASTGPQGAVDAASPTASPAASNMPWPNQVDPTGTWGQRPDASVTTPVADPDMLHPHALIPGAPSSGAVPNLGYYRPTSGIAQGPGAWTQYTAAQLQNDPRIFRGPLASQPTAPAPGPIAPGAGAPWWQKLFGGGGQPPA